MGQAGFFHRVADGAWAQVVGGVNFPRHEKQRLCCVSVLGVHACLVSRCGRCSLQASVSRRKWEGSQGSLERLGLMDMEGRGCGQRLEGLTAQRLESQEQVQKLGRAGLRGL